ncbi:hypothetical protein HAX54_030487 [Datura stramonium]|uniref:Uncharacterized protein n=1 Tax=Datura stramonium TaxID=4076 RepID=A0ABS8V9V6_DATST|nr:hypothetical protein [Datura stramonium]
MDLRYAGIAQIIDRIPGTFEISFCKTQMPVSSPSVLLCIHASSTCSMSAPATCRNMSLSKRQEKVKVPASGKGKSKGKGKIAETQAPANTEDSLCFCIEGMKPYFIKKQNRSFTLEKCFNLARLDQEFSNISKQIAAREWHPFLDTPAGYFS